MADTHGKVSVIIVDDEAAARSRLRRLLAAEPGVAIVAECEDGRSAVDAIQRLRPELVFLDIEMPELSGFEVVHELVGGYVPHFVFVTAFNAYAVDAFAIDALDYLLKPFDAARFKVTMERALARIGDRDARTDLLAAIREISDTQREIRAAVAQLPGAAAATTARAPYLERIAVKTDGRVICGRMETVEYVEAASNYVRIHSAGKVHMVRETLSDLAARLDPDRFARIHRSTIVNRDRIAEIQPWFSGDALVILRDGTRLRLSRMYRDSLGLGPRNRLKD